MDNSILAHSSKDKETQSRATLYADGQLKKLKGMSSDVKFVVTPEGLQIVCCSRTLSISSQTDEIDPSAANVAVLAKAGDSQHAVWHLAKHDQAKPEDTDLEIQLPSRSETRYLLSVNQKSGHLRLIQKKQQDNKAFLFKILKKN